VSRVAICLFLADPVLQIGNTHYPTRLNSKYVDQGGLTTQVPKELLRINVPRLAIKVKRFLLDRFSIPTRVLRAVRIKTNRTFGPLLRPIPGNCDCGVEPLKDVEEATSCREIYQRSPLSPVTRDGELSGQASDRVIR